MRLAEEVVAESFAPAWRSLLAKRLDRAGHSQTDIALLLGVSQSAVSKHLAGKLGADPRIAEDARVVAAADRIAAGLHAKTMSPFEALLEAEALVRQLEDRGPICRIHEEQMPSLAGLGCDICVRVGATALLPEQAALQDLRAALRILESVPDLVPLVPYVGTNVARAAEGAKDVSQIAAVPGRLFVMRGALKVPAAPEFGVSRHMAEVLFAVLRVDARRLACMNLVPDVALLDAARRAGLSVAKVDPAFERAPGTLRFAGKVPDVFHHEGAFGVEPQAYFVAEDAVGLAMRLRALVS